MEHLDKMKAILHIRPNANFVLRGDVIEWLDAEQTEPTEKEIQDGFIAYNLVKEAEAEAKATAKAELLAKLGITQEEANLLLS